MKNTNRQQRLDYLRIREAEEILTEQEQAELSAIFAEMDAEEAEVLKPSLEESQRLLEEKAELEATVAQLQEIIAEQHLLLAEARAYLEHLPYERGARSGSGEPELQMDSPGSERGGQAPALRAKDISPSP